MMKFYVDEKNYVMANSYKEIVEQLNEASLFGKTDDIEDYMIETAEACKLQNDSEIDLTDYKSFVLSLVEKGFLSKEPREN